MPITKNHTQHNNVSKMYDAIKNDNASLIQEVEDAGGDIYDVKGNGKFFTRALSSNATSVIDFYLIKPDITAKIQQYKSIDFSHALRYASLDVLKIMTGIDLNINIQEILSNDSVVKSQELLFKTKLFLLMSNVSHNNDLIKITRSLSEIDVFHASLVTGNYEFFIFAYTHKEKLELEVPFSALKYILERFNFAYDKARGNKDSHRILALSDQILSIAVNEFERQNAIASLHTKTKGIISTIYLSLNDLCRKSLISKSSPRAKFIIDLLTKHKDSALTKAIVPYLKAELLANKHVNLEFLTKYKEALVTSEPITISISQDSLRRLLRRPDEPSEFDNKALEIGQTFLERTLSESGIDISNIKDCIHSSAKESLVIKQAIMNYAIRKYGIDKTLPLIKHVSYLKALYCIGYNPFDIMPYIKDAKILTRLMEDLSKS
jgi:hypothetical protein